MLLHERAHIVLSNGANKKDKNKVDKDKESASDKKEKVNKRIDENLDTRIKLKSANLDIQDRLLTSDALGHNKFAVVVKTLGRKAIKAWSGSTNFTTTGLCTQLNNGILIENADVAQLYLDQWDRLKNAGYYFPPELISANAQSPRIVNNIDVWFSRVRNPSTKNTEPGIDIEALINHVNSAKEIILYVMFEPGPEPLESILKLSDKLYVRGVVSTLTSSNEETFRLKGIDTNSVEYKTALIQPEGIGQDFAGWVKEVSHHEFLSSIGFAITHAKMIVIDPFSDDCKVITGSHNFSKSASEGNDENFVVIHGNKELAEAYAVACLSTYAHYRWRSYLQDHSKNPWEYLSDDPGWQNKYLTSLRYKESELWLNLPVDLVQP
jgi:phosphatidylserine/phosphatidylglycerophosphate/cardiolipin synthase-like enzyme